MKNEKTESYIVYYQIQNNDGYWKFEEKRYFTHKKGQHALVKKQFLKDFKNSNVKIINIFYE